MATIRPRILTATLASMRSKLSAPFLRYLAVSILVVLAGITAFAPPARAHAELLQSSPEGGETVGGSFHEIVLQFFGLDENAPQDAQLFDPAGNRIESVLARSGQRLVIPIDPLTVPGEYTVTYEVNGSDGDVTSESFTFRYDPAADEPKGITIDLGSDGIDPIGYGLLLVGAAITAFLVHRFLTALREHRAAADVSIGDDG